MKASFSIYVALGFLLSSLFATSNGQELPSPTAELQFRTNDVVAFVGGADIAAQQESGHLETLLTLGFQPFALRFRNFGWEGATVFDYQPRDFGFPAMKTQLQKAGISILFFQYGRAEAMETNKTSKDFKVSYQKMIDEYSQLTPRIVLVIPPPFENGGGLLPDLSLLNTQLSSHATVIRELAKARHMKVVDLYNQLSSAPMKLTENGMEFTPRGHIMVARAFARELGIASVAEQAGEIDQKGRWSDARFERVRQEILAKNRLWFNYWRPQNWAFLGGDRTTQPSSRDHRDPAVRWFPEETERFLPLIQESENRISQTAATIHP
jgi:hypothetical protein